MSSPHTSYIMYFVHSIDSPFESLHHIFPHFDMESMFTTSCLHTTRVCVFTPGSLLPHVRTTKTFFAAYTFSGLSTALVLSFLALSISNIHLNIIISATSNFYAFFTARASAPYTIAGVHLQFVLITLLVTFQGYYKVLGKGHLPKQPVIVKAKFFSKGAEERIKAAGGACVLVP